jgi:hypothetical protein
MKLTEEQQLKMEIQHIFASGANEIRMFEMTRNFINKRYVTSDLSKHIVSNCEHEPIGDDGELIEICKHCGESYLDIP